MAGPQIVASTKVLLVSVAKIGRICTREYPGIFYKRSNITAHHHRLGATGISVLGSLHHHLDRQEEDTFIVCGRTSFPSFFLSQYRTEYRADRNVALVVCYMLIVVLFVFLQTNQRNFTAGTVLFFFLKVQLRAFAMVHYCLSLTQTYLELCIHSFALLASIQPWAYEKCFRSNCCSHGMFSEVKPTAKTASVHYAH